jgi:23S rRNA pseudouridine2604 synthase
MCKAVGNEVKKLKRVRVLNIELGAMKPGEQRRIRGEELEELYRIAEGVPEYSSKRSRRNSR